MKSVQGNKDIYFFMLKHLCFEWRKQCKEKYKEASYLITEMV